jgi:PDZ domain
MTSPKHLWAGDWERDSAAAAQGRATRPLPDSRPHAPDPEPAPTPRRPISEPRRLIPEPGRPVPEPRRPISEPQPAAVPRVRKQWRPRIRLPKPRIVVLSVIALLLIAGAAYGLTNLGATTTKNASASGTPWLGAGLDSWPAGGALVSSVIPGSPAAVAGLKPGDVIIQVQGRPVSGPINVSEAVSALSVGNELQLLAARGSHTLAMTATLGARPPDTP